MYNSHINLLSSQNAGSGIISVHYKAFHMLEKNKLILTYVYDYRSDI